MGVFHISIVKCYVITDLQKKNSVELYPASPDKIDRYVCLSCHLAGDVYGGVA